MTAETAKKIGPVLATFVVANNMIGSGFFLLPASLAEIGGVTAFSWLVGTLIAMALGGAFARLARQYPDLNSPDDYVRPALGRDMGFLAAATWLPWLLISLPAGVWIDRGDARRIMIGADLWSAAVTASVPVAWAFGHLTLAHVFAAALGVGFGSVFFRTAYASLVPQVVAKDDLEQANS